MARSYHNLDGFMRDVRAALLAGDQRAYETAELLDELYALINPEEPDTGLDEAGDSSVQLDLTDVGVRDGGDGDELVAPAQGHDSLRNSPLGGVSGLVSPALGHAHATAAAQAAVSRGAGVVVRTSPELDRRSTFAPKVVA